MSTEKTITGALGKNVGFSMDKTNTVPTPEPNKGLGMHTDIYGRTYVQTTAGRVYGTTKNI